MGECRVLIVQNMNVVIQTGEVIAVIGGSDSGKTTRLGNPRGDCAGGLEPKRCEDAAWAGGCKRRLNGETTAGGFQGGECIWGGGDGEEGSPGQGSFRMASGVGRATFTTRPALTCRMIGSLPPSCAFDGARDGVLTPALAFE